MTKQLCKVNNDEKTMQVKNNDSEYKLIPLHKQKPYILEECYKLLELAFPHYFHFRLVSIIYTFIST